MAINPPLLDRASSEEREAYENFFRNTEPEVIEHFSTGSSLTNLVDSAGKVHQILIRYNAVFNTWNNDWGNNNDILNARQWEIDSLSEVKQRLAKAIVHKRDYYENHWFGLITKFVLKLFCMWNQGNTSSIIAAEDFLLRWDLRFPLNKINGNYEKCNFFTFLVPPGWYRENLVTENFFNYDPPTRIIPVNRPFTPHEQPPPFMILQTP